MFEAFSDHAEGEGLHAGDRFISVSSVAHHASQGRHFGKPAAVVLAFNFYRKHHARTVASGRLSNKRMEPRRASGATRQPGARLIRDR